jgi:hypothetical protein
LSEDPALRRIIEGRSEKELKAMGTEMGGADIEVGSEEYAKWTQQIKESATQARSSMKGIAGMDEGLRGRVGEMLSGFETGGAEGGKEKALALAKEAAKNPEMAEMLSQLGGGVGEYMGGLTGLAGMKTKQYGAKGGLGKLEREVGMLPEELRKRVGYQIGKGQFGETEQKALHEKLLKLRAGQGPSGAAGGPEDKANEATALTSQYVTVVKDALVALKGEKK